MMNLTVVQLIKLGQKYLSLWPEKPELLRYFTDYRAVQIARLVCRYFPALAIFTFIMQLYFASGYPFGQGSISQALNALPQALVFAIFLLSMPVQVLVYSGVKADKLLPNSLASWYHSGLDKIRLHGQERNALDGHTNNKSNKGIEKLATYNPRYIDLARLLQITFDDKSKQLK
jgi:hypothetical protein